MTKLQRMQERMDKDEKMCREINEALDILERGEQGYPYTTGVIKAILQHYDRREKDADDR